MISQADIVLIRHLRPLNENLLSHAKERLALLMYEAWELRERLIWISLI
jgi:hypothetical protein